MKLTQKQIELAKMYANKSKVPVEDVIRGLEKGIISFSELSQGILGTKVS